MTSCTSCGHESASTARFCSECGLPLLSPREGAEVISGTDKSDWLTSTDQGDDRAIRAPGVRRGVKHRLPLLAGGLVVLFVVWNLIRAPTTMVPGLVGELDAAPSSTQTTSDSGGDAVPVAEENESTTSTVDPDRAAVDVSDLDPALARYHLYAQQAGRLLRVDLADGSVDVRDVEGRLLGAFADRLYLVDQRAGVVSQPLDNLIGEEEVAVLPALEGPGEQLFAITLTTGGIIHRTTGDFTASGADVTMLRLDVTTGSQQQVELARNGSLGLVEVPGAGLFELTDDGFRFLADGSVWLYGERLIVIEECDSPSACERYWFDRETQERIDRPVPDSSSGLLLGASGRIAVLYADRGRAFVDTDTGETIPDLIGSFPDEINVTPEDFSPDERFLAAIDEGDGGDVQIHDLTRGVSWTLELPRTFNLSKVLFVPKSGNDDDS